jgi:hypothetical protein
MSDEYLNHLRTVEARAFYANYSITMVEIGTSIMLIPRILK